MNFSRDQQFSPPLHHVTALVYVFVGFWDWNNASQLPYVWHYVVRAVLNMIVRNANPRGHMCFWCLMFSLSGPCELLFLLLLLPFGPELW